MPFVISRTFGCITNFLLGVHGEQSQYSCWEDAEKSWWIVDDQRFSRYHADFRVQGKEFILKNLDSLCWWYLRSGVSTKSCIYILPWTSTKQICCNNKDDYFIQPFIESYYQSPKTSVSLNKSLTKIHLVLTQTRPKSLIDAIFMCF